MKKQILSITLCICMVLALTPVFATASENVVTTCNVLFEEDFEDNASALTIYDNKTAVIDGSGIYTIPDGAEYGQGNYALLLKNEDKNVQRTAFGVTSGKLQNGSGGYTVEVNFDWNPFVSSASNVVRVLCNSAVNATWNASNMSSTVSLYLVDNGDTQTLTVYNRGSVIVLDEADLVTKIGTHVTDPDHVYRTKVILTAADTTGTGATISVYLDDVLMLSFVNTNSTKDRYLCGLQFQHTNILERGTIDNIKVLEYGTGVSGADAYINDDALVTAIRRFEYEQSTIPENKQDAYSAAIATAKAAFEASDRTQTSVDAAVEALNNWDNVEEESEWSAEVSGIEGRKVTIKANEAISAGKIIVANYNGTDLARVDLPVFSGLAAGETVDVTVPDGWTGVVKVFFWDSNFDRLMPAEELTIQ